MKKMNLFAVGCAAILMAGCSSDDITPGEGGGAGSNGTSYVGLSITLPSTSGNRAESFESGTANEYKVNDLSIYYFQGGKCVGQNDYTAEQLNWSTPPAGNSITTKAVLPVEKVNFAGNVEVLVVANAKGKDFGFPAVNGVWENKAATATAEGITGEELDNFFMANTVMNDGSSLVTVQTYPSENEAQNNASNHNIYLERAAAKVTLEANKANSYTVENTKATVTISGWTLDVTNKYMYPVRKFVNTKDFSADNGYARFYSNLYDYRTYWAVDPNYDGTNLDNQFNVITDTAAINTKVDEDNYEYCLENTFDVKNQRQNQTTRVLIKAVYTPADFTPGSNWYTLGNSSAALSAEKVKELIAGVVNAGQETKAEVVLVEDEIAAGKAEISAAMFTVDNNEPTEAQVKAVQSALGNITAYKNGVCFYVARIKHFGDDVCPWGKDNGYPTYVTGGEGMSETFLGRYGVVRNNWYKVTINSITQPGEPTIPELKTEQDDEHANYIQTTVNILDWAVRTQGVDL